MNGSAERSDELLATVAHERGKQLGAYAYLLTGNFRDAEDLVQDALVKTFVRAKCADLSSAEGYVRRAMLTIYIDGYRRRRQWERIQHLLARDERRDGPADDVVARQDVQSALRRLSPQQRACVVLRYFGDLPVAETARELQLAEGTVKRYLSVAVGRLEKILGPVAPAATDDTMLVIFGEPT